MCVGRRATSILRRNVGVGQHNVGVERRNAEFDGRRVDIAGCIVRVTAAIACDSRCIDGGVRCNVRDVQRAVRGGARTGGVGRCRVSVKPAAASGAARRESGEVCKGFGKWNVHSRLRALQSW